MQAIKPRNTVLSVKPDDVLRLCLDVLHKVVGKIKKGGLAPKLFNFILN